MDNSANTNNWNVSYGALLPSYLKDHNISNESFASVSTTGQESYLESNISLSSLHTNLTTISTGNCKTCFLCNTTLKKEETEKDLLKDPEFSNRMFNHLYSSIYHRLNEPKSYKPVLFYLNIIALNENNIPLHEKPTIIPFKAFLTNLNDQNLVDPIRSRIEIRKQIQPFYDPYFATINLGGYISRLMSSSDPLTNYPGIEVSNGNYLSFEIFNDNGELEARWVERINVTLFENERIYHRYSRYILTTWNHPFNIGLRSERQYLQNQTEICILNYKRRFFLVGSIRLNFKSKISKLSNPSQSLLCIGPESTSIINEDLIYASNQGYKELFHLEKSLPQATCIGCKNCLINGMCLGYDNFLKLEITQREQYFGIDSKQIIKIREKNLKINQHLEKVKEEEGEEEEKRNTIR